MDAAIWLWIWSVWAKYLNEDDSCHCVFFFNLKISSPKLCDCRNFKTKFHTEFKSLCMLYICQKCFFHCSEANHGKCCGIHSNPEIEYISIQISHHFFAIQKFSQCKSRRNLVVLRSSSTAYLVDLVFQDPPCHPFDHQSLINRVHLWVLVSNNHRQ